jgi:elongator complex protein 3
MPKSYLSSQPAAARALRNKFHPYRQVASRIAALEDSGHPVSKLEIIVMGGTWSFLPRRYQNWYIKNVYDAANQASGIKLQSRNLAEAITLNETAKHRIIGLTLETRPDHITQDELALMRTYGCTRVEIGVQTIDDEISDLNFRDQTKEQVAYATKLMREFGFKFCYHLMPGLYGSTPEKDLIMLREIFENADYKPDFVKIYPCQVLPNSLLANWWKEGKFEPLHDVELIKLLLKMKQFVPEWTRIMRLLRDIPVGNILSGAKFSNLRQILKSQPKKLKEVLGETDFDEIFHGKFAWPCRCIRCREVGFSSCVNSTEEKQSANFKLQTSELELIRRNYEAAGGMETFLSFESPDQKTLYALLRLRKPDENFVPVHFPSVLKNAALIREVHSYGSEITVGDSAGVGQHRGLGRKLIAEAERIARDEWGLKRMTIIAGVGTREYYRKFGYAEKCTYMTKRLERVLTIKKDKRLIG